MSILSSDPKLMTPAHTEFGSVAARPNESGRLGPEFTYVSAATVVRAALAGVERNRATVIPGPVMKLAIFFLCLTPMPIPRLTARFFARAR